MTHLKPLPVGLHLEDYAWIGFGQSIPVRYSFAGHTELHFCQTWAVEETQRGGSWLVDVTHCDVPCSGCRGEDKLLSHAVWQQFSNSTHLFNSLRILKNEFLKWYCIHNLQYAFDRKLFICSALFKCQCACCTKPMSLHNRNIVNIWPGMGCRILLPGWLK